MLLAVEGNAAVYNERIAIVLGFISLGLALASFASCRTFVSLLGRLGIKNLQSSKAYSAFNKYHAYYWWLWGVFVLAHLMMGTFHTGFPQSGDPDAPIHWTILALGLLGALSGAALFSSCRISPALLSHQLPGVSFANKSYLSFFKHHSYYWWIFAAVVAGHIAAAYFHAGLWPLPG